MNNLKIVDNAIVKELITNLRDIKTPFAQYQKYTCQLTKFLIYEALSDIATETKVVDTQTGTKYTGDLIPHNIAFLAIMRAGLGMLAPAIETFEFGEYHAVGLKRNDEDPFDKEPNFYLDHLREMSQNIERIIIMDPMFATGGTMLAVIERLRKIHKYTGKIDIVCLIAAKPGVEKVWAKHSDVKITCAGFDTQLNEKGYIVPGLGDAGDRFFGIKTNLEHIK